LTEADSEALSTIMEDFVRSREMGFLYSQVWDVWHSIGEGPFMQFVEIDSPSRWGSWGLLADPGDSTPRARFLLAKRDQGGSWWGEGGGPQYLQGITANATEAADNIVGTDEEDYLAGLGGDDTFVASTGRDGLNGGLGLDTYVISGPEADYTIAPEGRGVRVTGAASSTFLLDFEQVTFGDGTTLSLD
jgi:Ca2+-binding RTX toxin-like protein